MGMFADAAGQATGSATGAPRDLTGTDMRLLMRAGQAGDLSQFAPGTPDYEARYADERAGYEKRHKAGMAAGALGLAAPFVLGTGLLGGIGAAEAGAGAALDPTGLAAADIGFNSAGQLGMAGGLGAGGAAALGLDPTGLGAADVAFNSQGQLGLSSAAGGAAPSPTTTKPLGAGSTQPAAAGGAAPTSSAGTTGATTGNMSFTDSLLKQMKDNALALGLMGAGTMASLGAGKSAMPNEAQLQGLGTDAANTARMLMAQYQTGNLSPGQQASLDQLTQNTKNQLRQYFSSIGQADSTAAVQAMSQVDAQALQMKQQILDTALQQGLAAVGVASGPLNTIAQYQLGQDQQLKQAFGNFAGGIGMLMGRNSGTTQQPRTAASTAPAQVVSSTQAPAMP